MDFLKVTWRNQKKNGTSEIYPIFIVKSSKDLMIRGGDFYAVWDERKGLWSKSQDDAVELIDSALDDYKATNEALSDSHVLYLWNGDTGMIDKWHKYCQKQMRDNFHPLDEKLVFANSPVNREDYASMRLPYALEEGDISAWDELVGTLYSPTERMKIEWAIGSIVAGDSKDIQKFLVFYGSAGTGKSTILNVIQKLFNGYCTVFDAKSLGSSTDVFALEPFKNNPLVAIQHDGDLSRIEDNTRLNSLVSHEEMTVNEKYSKLYSTRFHSMLFMGTNRPVKITDSKSGIIRRLIDVSPTEQKIPLRRYNQLVKKIDFELGAIAAHCLKVYEENKDIYNNYIPKSMIGATNYFYNFMEENLIDFQKNGVTLVQAWAKYNEYCNEAKVPYPYSKMIFKEELKTYFEDFKERAHDAEGKQVWNYYSGLKVSKFGIEEIKAVEEKDISREGETDDADSAMGGNSNWLKFDAQKSILDIQLADAPAQYAREDTEGPWKKWDSCQTVLRDIDTSRLHYVRVPENHIVIDFDLKDESGEKSLEKNLEAASKWPATYAELSKSGKGIHLHYIYNGDVNKLSRIYEPGIEVKVFTGKSSLRRLLTKCVNLTIAVISSGLPLKVETKMVNFESIKNEKAIRTLIQRSLAKEYPPHATVTSVDFIFKVLTDAYNQGLHYDVTDLRPDILTFAARSSHHANDCLKVVNKMPFKSEEPSEEGEYEDTETLVFYDIEVFSNLFLVNWKKAGKDQKVVRMINPTPNEIEDLIRLKLVGFNCRRYDNHILYARMLGYSNEQLYELSQRIINGSPNAFFAEAYNLSYTDVYDFCSKKQSLKKWEIELGIHHQELGLPWDKPVPEELWPKVAEYCDNDVIATEAVFYSKSGQADFVAREILADISGLSVNATTNQHTTRIIFGAEKKPQSQFVYTDLSKMFPGYKFDHGKSTYRGEETGEGGYVYAEPGMYRNIALLDIASMHPTSIEQLNLFGQYTKNFSDIKQARIYIKHQDFEAAGKMFGGKLARYLTSKEQAKALSYALKIAINSVYGLTSANFENPFKDPRNIDNIVAKRGALFMINLKHEVQERGYTVAHIKTDSIKIPDAKMDIIEFVVSYGKKFGYNFEHEATYEKMCLVNDAVYIAKYATVEYCENLYGKDYVNKDYDTLKDCKEEGGKWTATGTQFQVPFVFKTLFSHEPIEFSDLCETKTVTSALYLDMNENLPDVSEFEKQLAKVERDLKDIWGKDWQKTLEMVADAQFKDKNTVDQKTIDISNDLVREYTRLSEEIEKGHAYQFVGKAGLFCPINPGCGGGLLLREKDGKYNSATGAKGYRWMESEMVRALGKEKDIDRRYYVAMVDEAISSISKYGDFEAFAS